MELIKINHEQFGLSGIQATEIANKFLPVLEEMQPLLEKYAEIKDLDPADSANSKQFKDLRLKLVKVRTGAAKIHKDEKAYYLAGGKYVDSWKNKQLEITEPIEADLSEKEKYIEIQEQNRKNALRDERLAELAIFEADGSMMNLGEMSDEMYDAVLTGAKAKREQRLKDEKEAEIERIKKAKYDEEIQQEEVIWAMYYQHIADNEAAEEKAEADRKEIQRQAEIKAENERKAEAKKQRLASLAPDKEKALNYIEELRAVKFPEFTTDEYKQKKPKFGNLMAMAIKELIGE